MDTQSLLAKSVLWTNVAMVLVSMTILALGQDDKDDIEMQQKICGQYDCFCICMGFVILSS